MKLTAVTSPNVRQQLAGAATRYTADLRRAAVIATDRAAREAQGDIKARISGVGLGRLGGAVGYTSMARQTRAGGANAHVVAYRSQGDPYGVLYARGGDDSLAGGALESYTRGSVIRANRGQWLAFQTNAIPRKIGRYRVTPERYRGSGLETSIGKLEFRPIGPNRAILVIKNVSLSPKNGRAKKLGPRGTRTRIAKKEIVAFVLIRVTRRAARFDKDILVFARAQQVPDFMLDALEQITRARGRGG